jgi:hypothetical protein
MNKAIIIFFLCFTIAIQPAVSQNIAVKTNLLYGGVTLTPNLGAEVGLTQNLSFDMRGSYNPWNLNGTMDNNKKLVHWMAQAELRYWLCQTFDGHFFGAHGLYAQYNIGQQKLDFIFGNNSKNYRFQGNAFGIGLSYGYQWLLTKRWSIEANIGVGVAYMNYDKYGCQKCGSLVGTEQKVYVGPTRVSIAIMYIIN